MVEEEPLDFTMKGYYQAPAYSEKSYRGEMYVFLFGQINISVK
jgi:hypothetical protein